MSAVDGLVRTSRAEWGRIWSVRSSWVLAGATSLVVVAFGTLLGANTDPATVEAGSTAWDGGRSGGMFALFGILALAVVAATADHATGGIVPTLQWTPRRGVLLTARATAIVVTTTALGVVLVTVASIVIGAFLPELGLPLDDGAAVLGGLTFVFATGGLLSVGLGLFLRSTAGGLVAVLALIMVLPFLLAQLGYSWSMEIAARLPGASALFLVFGDGPSEEMTIASARLTLLAWAAGAITVGGWRLLRADADR